jgi:hypothetical protein
MPRHVRGTQLDQLVVGHCSSRGLEERRYRGLQRALKPHCAALHNPKQSRAHFLMRQPVLANRLLHERHYLTLLLQVLKASLDARNHG